MELTNFQKGIINQILISKIYDINSFLNFLPRISSHNFNVPTFSLNYENGGKIVIPLGCLIYLFNRRDYAIVKNLFLEFISLWDFLDGLYIKTTKLDKSIKDFAPIIDKEILEELESKYNNILDEIINDKKFCEFLDSEVANNVHKVDINLLQEVYFRNFNGALEFINRYKNDDSVTYNSMNLEFQKDFAFNVIFKDIINKISFEKYTQEFYPTTELRAFVNRDYKTYEEWHTEEARKDRKMGIWIPMIIAIITVIISAIINYFIYSEKRDVKIINQKDTTKVIIIPQDKIDTLKLNNQDSTQNK